MNLTFIRFTQEMSPQEMSTQEMSPAGNVANYTQEKSRAENVAFIGVQELSRIQHSVEDKRFRASVGQTIAAFSRKFRHTIYTAVITLFNIIFHRSYISATFSKSQKGGTVLTLDGHYHKTKQNKASVYWSCQLRRQATSCPDSVTTPSVDDATVLRSCENNHDGGEKGQAPPAGRWSTS